MWERSPVTGPGPPRIVPIGRAVVPPTPAVLGTGVQRRLLGLGGGARADLPRTGADPGRTATLPGPVARRSMRGGISPGPVPAAADTASAPPPVKG